MDGKTSRIGSERTVVLDVLDQAREVPSFPVERWFELDSVVSARAAASVRISWVTLFAKAYALACMEVPELRRQYISFPRAGFYQSRYTVINVAINRMVNGQERLFFGRLKFPEEKKLPSIQSELDTYVHGDVRQVFRQQLLSSRLPRWIRQLGWWWRKNIIPAQRARRFGTASISTLAGHGVLNRLHPCILASSLSYGPLDNSNRMWVTLQCDHRLVDGVPAARALNRLHDILQDDIVRELTDLQDDERHVA